MDQPGKVASPARGQLNRENDFFPCLRSRLIIWSRETGSTVPSRISLLILHTQAESGALLTGFLPISAAASIYLSKPPYAIGSVPSLSGHAIAYRWRSLPRIRRHRASKPQGSSNNGCCHFAGHHGPINVRLSFSHTHYTNIGTKWAC